MPCTYEYPGEREQNALAQSAKMKKDLDRLTAELDKTREAVVTLLEGGQLSEDFVESLDLEQRKHRQEDLTRLKKRLAEMTKAVKNADPKKPLAPQLGFDPDII